MTIAVEAQLLDAVAAAMAETPDVRLRDVMTAFVTHAHAFLREVRPTEREFEYGLRFLQSLGEHCTAQHNEVVLAADTLGLSTLVTLINLPASQAATAPALLGPFWRPDAPYRFSGANITSDETRGEPLVVSGTVRDEDGAPIACATVDVWQAADNGLYDNQDAAQPDMNGRGRFLTGKDGQFRFETVRPVGYDLPPTGPVADLLRTQGRTAHRPAHLHFMISGNGFRTLVTRIFVTDGIDAPPDATFSVVPALIPIPVPITGEAEPGAALHYDFTLARGESRLPAAPIA
jgi:catechol 1,2-dioxygenase